MDNVPSTPEWAQPNPSTGKSVVGIDLSKLSSADLQKFISLMEEIDYVPANVAWGVEHNGDNQGG